MNNFIKFGFLSFVLIALVSCNKTKDTNQESILKGKATLYVDETFQPIMEDEIEIFESNYEAKIKLVAKSENEIIVALAKDSSNLAVLSRPLNKQEMKFFNSKKIIPKITPIATDAIAFVANKRSNDSLVALKDVVSFLKGQASPIKGLVFDNLNSSTVRFFTTLAEIKELPKKNIYSFETNNEVIQFVAENNGLIGVVGLNWLTQPSAKMQSVVDQLTVMNVKGLNQNNYFAPDQNNIAEKKYALARDLYIVNCQGYSGLGMGFASFVAGDIGQRIILKSGLMPTKVPPRKLNIRKEIINEKK